MHFAQNENQEKLSYPTFIGHFGVGLKDAMATFARHDVGVEVLSRHGLFTLGKSSKYAFDDVMMLHAYIELPVDKIFEGTEFILTNISKTDIERAKRLFSMERKFCLRYNTVNSSKKMRTKRTSISMV